MDPERVLAAVRAVVEPLAALVACFLLIAVLSMPFVGAVDLAAPPTEEQLARLAQLAADPLLLTIQSGVLLGAGFWLAWRRVAATPRERQMGHLRALALGGAGGLVALALSAVLSSLLEVLGLPVQEQPGLELLLGDPRSLRRLAPWVIGVMPLAEEMFFRSYAFRFIRQQLGIPAGVILSSLMFAVIHFNPSGFLVYLIIGSVMAYTYQLSARLITPVVGHATLNALVLLVYVIHPAGAKDPVAPAGEFVDITREARVDFVHVNGATAERLLPETLGGGVAFFDYDGDRDPDLLFVNSSRWEWDPGGRQAVTPALYRNDGSGRFEDVTRSAGLDFALFGMGAAIGDYDNDGDTDLFMTALGGNRLMRNDAGRFQDVTSAAGVGGGESTWSTSAGFVDIDRDGDLDLFVCNYVEWSRQLDLAQGSNLEDGGRAYGRPIEFGGVHPYLYRNDGAGVFSDVSASAGVEVSDELGRPLAKALGVTFIDIDGDGFPEIFLANDTVPNMLFHNQGDGTFREIGMAAGFALDSGGRATGSMGIDAAHYRNDHSVGVAVGNFADEMTSLYLSRHLDLQFADEAIAEGIGRPSSPYVTFGLFFFDYDLDGRLDLLLANGHLDPAISEVDGDSRHSQPAQLFWNRGPGAPGSFVELPSERIGDLARPLVGRGAAYADVDGDGDLDVLLAQNGEGALLLRNDQRSGHNWVRLSLRGTRANRDAIGSWIELSAGGIVQRRQVMPTRSYLSQVELPVTFGLGKADRIDRVDVIWTDGSTEQIEGAPINGWVEIAQRGVRGQPALRGEPARGPRG